MLGLQLFRHAFKMLFHDVWTTVRLTLFPFLICAMVLLVVGSAASGFIKPQAVDGAIPSGLLAALIAAALFAIAVFVFAMCWAAVGWHRYVLLGENSNGLLPRLNWPYVKAYFGAGLRFLLVAIAGLFLLLLLIAVLPSASSEAMLSRLIVWAGILIVSAVLSRFSLVLPAAALGKPITLRTSWEATRDYQGALFVIVIATWGVNFLLSLFGGLGVLLIIVAVFGNWLSFALGISILTALYGFCIEKRALG